MSPNFRDMYERQLISRFKSELEYANRRLGEAEKKQLTNEKVRMWLQNLKEVIFRADDLTDDKIYYEVSTGKLEGASMLDMSVKDEMEDILADLKHLFDEFAGLGVDVGVDELPLRSSGAPFSVESEVYGRDDDKKAIMKLVQSDNKEPMFIPIVGMGGIGKTTLAQLVFSDDRADFQIKAWVTVSTESNELTLIKRIFEEVTSTESSIEVPTQPRKELKKALEGKKFLFVLDDVRENNSLFWHYLNRAIEFAASGSKIIITTRSTHVACTVNENREEHFYLGRLSDSTCWEFFIQPAFKNEDLNAHPDLREIGEELVRKCEGLPLAVKSVAAFLSSKDRRTILENNIWESRLRKDILPVFWLSYSDLSPELKRCFAYCSIFPRGYEFRRREVILLWKAEGLLQSEDDGDKYITTLISKFFFKRVKSTSFIMQSCMHDLATFVFGDFGFRLEENDLDKLPKRARHLSIMKKYIRDLKQFEGVFDAKFLRTFLTLDFNRPSQHMVPLQELLMNGERLRVVSLSHYLSITELPDCVGKLKHLRYFDLSNTAIKEIPSMICSLYNLETLLLKNCGNLTRLPSEFRRLCNLRHFDFDGSPIKEFPPQICNLKDLQTLTGFIVRKEDGGSRIKELGDLQCLHGKFAIWGLENVVDVENVSAANLRDKEFHMLGLYWNGGSAGSSDPGQHKLVLDQLQPHTNLEELYISGYNGTSFSDWMGDQSFRNIVKAELVKCGNCNSLSPIEQLPSLKELLISQWLVETLSLEFNSNGSSKTKAFEHLEALYFVDMPYWEEWLFADDAVFPCLKQLRFDECPKLDVRLPDCFPALTNLAVSCCRQLMPLLIPGSTHQGTGKRFSSLEELQIFACPEQKHFSNVELPSSLKNISTPDLPPKSGD